MRFIISLLIVLILNDTFAQQLVYPDNYLIPNNFAYEEYGDPWPGTTRVKTNGNIIVYAWSETGIDTSNYALCYKVTDRWGNIIHDVDTVKAPTQSQIYKSPQLDIFSDGKFIITWMVESNPTFGRDAYYQVFDQNGFKINNEVRINLDSTNADQFGVPVVFPNGNYCIVLFDQILNPPSGLVDCWVQCFDSLHNRIGDYSYIGRYNPAGNWSRNIAINDTTILIIKPANPGYHIKSIRVNDKGEKLDSTWFEWTAFQMDSIYTILWEVEYYNGSIYASTRKPTYANLYSSNTVIAKFSYDSSLVTDTVTPVPSKIVQITPWKVANDDTLQTNVMSLMPALGIMHDLGKIVVSWPDNRNYIGCLECLELNTQYYDTNLIKTNANFISASPSGQTFIAPEFIQLAAAKDFFAQLWIPHADSKMWTNIWSLTTSVSEVSQNQKFLIYPNPVSDKIMIKSDLKFSEFNIHDVLGKLIVRGDISEKAIDVSQLQNGIYILNLIDGKKQNIYREKFIKISNTK